MNPYTMWREQSPRQVFQLLKSYKDMNKDAEEEEVSKKKNYTAKSKKAVLPDWYDTPEGAIVHHADDIHRGDI